MNLFILSATLKTPFLPLLFSQLPQGWVTDSGVKAVFLGGGGGGGQAAHSKIAKALGVIMISKRMSEHFSTQDCTGRVVVMTIQFENVERKKYSEAGAREERALAWVRRNCV